MGALAGWWDARRATRAALLLAAGAAAAYLLYQARGILAPFIVAVAATYILDPFVEWLTARRLHRTWAALLAFLTVIAAFALFFGFLGPGLIDEFGRLIDALPALFRDLQRLIAAAQRGYARVPLPEALRGAVERAVLDLEAAAVTFFGNLAQGALGLFSSLLTLLLAPVLSFYMLKDLPRIRRAVVDAIPARRRGEVLALLHEVDQALGGYVRGQLTVALIVGILVTIGLTLVGAPFALLFGAVAGLAETIPVLGPFIGAAPAVVVAFARSPLLALKVALVFATVQPLEASIISPRIIGGRLGLHPLVVIFAILAGAKLLGFWGVLLAVPAIAALRPVARYLLRRL